MRVEGLTTLIRNLRRIDSDFPKELQRENKAFAQSIVPRVQAAYSAHYPKVESRGRRRRGKNSVSQIRAVATQKTAGVRIGGVRYSYMPGQEWGSNRYKQFAPATNGRGRFLRPTVTKALPEFRRAQMGALDKVLARVFPRRSV